MPRASILVALAPLAALAILPVGCGSTVTTSSASSSTSPGTGGSGQGGAAAGGAGGTAPVGGAGGTTHTPTECTPEDCESAYFTCCDLATGATTGVVCGPPSCQAHCPDGTTPDGAPPNGVCPVGVGADCRADADCIATAYCDFPDDRCGGGEGGTCVARPAACDKSLEPTCTCGGATADNPCEGAKAGSDVNATGGCAAPAGTFACGAHFCAHGTQYCHRDVSDVAGQPDAYACTPLPDACGATPTCACLAAAPCGGSCEASADGDLQVTCPGG